MDASACMKSLLLAASQYRAARTQPNAALLQRSLEVRDSLGRLPGSFPLPPHPTFGYFVLEVGKEETRVHIIGGGGGCLSANEAFP